MTRLFVIAGIFLFASGCGHDASAPKSHSAPPYSDAYRGLTPLSDAEAGKRAIQLCRREQSLTDGKVLHTKAPPSAPDYTEVVVQGTIDGKPVERVVWIHKFNAKGDQIKNALPKNENDSAPVGVDATYE